MKKKIEVPFLTYFLINLLSLTLVIDLISIVFNKYIFDLIIGFILIIITNFFLVEKIKFKNRFNKTDLIYFVILAAIMVVTLPYPDRSYDSFNYHLFLQQNSFVDKINYNFLPSSEIQTFTYAFADRAFYIFRFLTSYRLGLILNYILLTVIYYEAKDIIRKNTKENNDLIVSVLSIPAVITISLIDILDSYYIDLLSLTVLIVLFKNVMYVKDNDNFKLKYLFYSLMFGFCFITKISNAFFLIVLFIIYLINNWNSFKKTINIKNICVLLFGLLITITPYMLYTYMQTGNPVFPFYNTIFKSEYYSVSDWMDTRFGPQYLKQVLVWPLYILKHPEKACDISIVEPIWCYGWIMSIIIVCYYTIKKILKKKINNELLVLSITNIIMNLVWAKFVLGYTRYGFITLVLSIIVFYISLYYFIKNKRYVLVGLLIVLLINNYQYDFSHFFNKHEEWIYHNYFSYEYNKEYRDNLKNLFARGEHVDLEEGAVWGVIYSNSGLLNILNSDIPIIQISKGNVTEKDIEIKNDILENATHIYTAIDIVDFNNFFESLQKTEYGIKSIKKVLNSKISKNSNSYMYVFELSKDSIIKNYKIFESEINFDLSNDFYIGISNQSSGLYINDLNVTAKYEKDKEKSNIGISANGFLTFVKVDSKNKINSIKYTLEDKVVNGYWFMLLY